MFYNIRSGTAPKFWTSCKIRESTTDFPSEAVVRGEEMVESLAKISHGRFVDGNAQCRRGLTNKSRHCILSSLKEKENWVFLYLVNRFMTEGLLILFQSHFDEVCRLMITMATRMTIGGSINGEYSNFTRC